MNSGSALGICVLPEKGMNLSRTVLYPHYLFEILDHAGLFHRRIDLEALECALDEIRILVTVGEAELPESLRRKLDGWVGGGGAWLSIAGICGMEQTLGAKICEPEMWSWAGGIRSLGEGYLAPVDRSHPVMAAVTRPVHLFGGATVLADGATVLARVNSKHGRPTDRPAVLEKTHGRGRAMLIAADVTGTIVRIQQGVGVTRDGVPAPDGSAPTNDLVLKADDGAVLDWELDRDLVPGVKNYRAFLEPMADIWREILLRSIFHLAREQRVALPLLWLYPRRLTALAHMSHDSDSNEPEKAERLLELLDEAEVKTTWCIILPGYDAALTAKIKAAGHELATHYDAIDEGMGWSSSDLQQQYRKLREMFGEAPVSNKNHMARWEGDTEFFHWCGEVGIEIDQSKAASKTGEAGYNFGTCHVYFPITFTGQTIDCLELCTPVWDLHVFAPVEIFAALLDSVRRHHGILHQLFHPYHVPRAEVAEALVHCVRQARQAGLEWWTARQLNAWERARRTVKLERLQLNAGGAKLRLRAGVELPDATILLLKPSPEGGEESFVAWGFEFDSVVQTLEAQKPTMVELSASSS